MKDEFLAYLRALNTSEVLNERIKKIYDDAVILIPDELDYIFLSGYVNSDGVTQYDNLYFFSPHFVFVAKSFIQLESYDIVLLMYSVSNFSIEKQNYDLKKPINSSRLTLSLWTSNSNIIQFRASGENCQYLMRIVESRIMPTYFVTENYVQKVEIVE